MPPHAQVAEKGTVFDNFELGRIEPDGGGETVNFAPPSVKPSGSWPTKGDRVEFVRYAESRNWARYVKRI
jgi:hypothetical protein